ncbi:MAG: hypothetical protein GC149_00955 [Gammaproteobacteria bacterium]|nr:hypothetical protein [Gammaproteobacteria bacterium]
MKFLDELKMQRWDDHRYYHQSRINQSLHLLSAMSFLGAYVLLFINPPLAAFLGWIVAMLVRQAGHFFFEPKGYDAVNETTHEHKEEIKVGYNLQRKVVLLSIWALSPLALYYYPTMFGIFEPYTDLSSYLNNLGMIWLVLGFAALLFRTVHLFFIQNVQSGLVWFSKIMTDPFHDIKIYHKSPVYLLKGEFLDPMHHVK